MDFSKYPVILVDFSYNNVTDSCFGWYKEECNRVAVNDRSTNADDRFQNAYLNQSLGGDLLDAGMYILSIHRYQSHKNWYVISKQTPA